jgi:hypothetical protein
MKHYQKPDNSIWAFELNGSQDHLITGDMTLIGAAELAAMRAATVNPKDEIRSRISALEVSITPRRMRDAILSGDSSFIKQVDADITKLRAKL